MKKIPETSILKKRFTIPFFNMDTMRKIFKKNRKKPNIYRKKRKTFTGILSKNILISLVVTAIFAGGLFEVGKEYIFSKAQPYSLFLSSCMQQRISNDIQEGNTQDFNAGLDLAMEVESSFNIVLDKSKGNYQMSSANDKSCGYVFMRLTDKDGNITNSSRMALSCYMTFNEEEVSKPMICDTDIIDIAELKQLEKDYLSFSERNENFRGKYPIENYSIRPFLTMKSAYVNKEECKFIPHETELNLTKYYLEHSEPDQIIETKSYTINMPETEGYELIEFDLSGINREIISNGTYPKYIMLNFRGTDKDVFDKINSEYPPEPSLIGGNGYAGSDVKIYYNNAEIYIDNELHTLMVFLKVNAWNSVTKPFYFRILIIFLLAVLVIAFLDAWRKNVRNQAEYMFEDYQTNLTNSLAHDLKTPLTAIGGYTENILSGSLSDTETTNYLNSIMESVAYTDSIITRTLELNRMNQLKEPQRQNNSIHTIIEKTIEKYSVMLDERNITVTTDGQAEISANTHLLETALENLVSNAVKYTSGNGNINIKISPERLVISNSVKQKTNVEKLKKPFAKGDDTRSNQSGSGLGLSIAETALLINGFRLSLSCTDSEFTTEIRF